MFDDLKIDLTIKNGHVVTERKPRVKNQSSPPTPKKDTAPVASKPAAPPIADPLDNYSPLAVITYIGVQFCPQCSRETHYIAGELLAYTHRDKCGGIATVRTRAFAKTDYRWTSLPRRREYLDREQCTCPECLSLDEAFNSAFDNNAPVQYLLDFPAPIDPRLAKRAIPAAPGAVKTAKATGKLLRQTLDALL